MEARSRTPRRRRNKSVAASGKAPAIRIIANREREDLADDVMGMIEDADARQTSHVSRAEQDEADALEVQFVNGLRGAITVSLEPQGLRCHSVIRDGEGRGYFIECRDAHGRRYTAEFHYAEGEQLVGRHDDWERRILHLVCGRILEARAKYFRRAGLS